MLAHFIRKTTERILSITILMGFPFTIVVGFLFTIVLGFQLTISKRFSLIIDLSVITQRHLTELGMMIGGKSADKEEIALFDIPEYSEIIMMIEESGKSKLLRKVRRIRRDFLRGLNWPRGP